MLAFKVTSDKDGKLIPEVAIPLLAMHCITRRISPRDFEVLIAVSIDTEDLYKSVEGNLTEYVKHTSVNLSAREQEILDLVLREFSNKGIGSKLNIAERTVKFHISNLLGKFKASDRASLRTMIGSVIGTNICAIPSAFKEKKSNAEISKQPATAGNAKLPSRSR